MNYKDFIPTFIKEFRQKMRIQARYDKSNVFFTTNIHPSVSIDQL